VLSWLLLLLLWVLQDAMAAAFPLGGAPSAATPPTSPLSAAGSVGAEGDDGRGGDDGERRRTGCATPRRSGRPTSWVGPTADPLAPTDGSAQQPRQHQ